MPDSRAFPNQLSDYNVAAAATDDFFDSRGQLTVAFAQRVRVCIDRLRVELDAALQAKSAPGTSAADDNSVYTGTAGIALTYLRLYTALGDAQLLSTATELSERAVKRCRGRRETFLCGDSGPLTVAAHLAKLNGDHSKSTQYAQKVVAEAPAVLQAASMPDELLYGRGGYLYALLYLDKHVAPVDQTAIAALGDRIVASGAALAAANRQLGAPLMYAWHDSLYLGAAHGLAGIFFVLLRLPSAATSPVLRSAIDYMLRQQYPGGNVRSSVGSGSDRLVHWCHGAPGAVHMFIQAHKVFGDAKYLNAALACGDCIWQRGLLKKGYGLCHGTAGNAYGLLALWQHTADPKWLHRTCQFATFIFDYGKHGCCTPDRPYSLMEGMAGTVYFLADLLQPASAGFPAFYW